MVDDYLLSKLSFSRDRDGSPVQEDEEQGLDGEPERAETEGAMGVEPELKPPDELTLMRLIRLFTPSMSRALEHLYPRRATALAWAQANAPPDNLLSRPPREVVSVAARLPSSTRHGVVNTYTSQGQSSSGDQGLSDLPRMAKFILVASFIASTNPAKTDMRMFGRGPDERKKKRKRGGSPRKGSAKSAAVKVSIRWG